MIHNKIKDNELGTSHFLSPGGGGGRISLEEHSFQGGMKRLTVILDRALWGKGTLGN